MPSRRNWPPLAGRQHAAMPSLRLLTACTHARAAVAQPTSPALPGRWRCRPRSMPWHHSSRPWARRWKLATSSGSSCWTPQTKPYAPAEQGLRRQSHFPRCRRALLAADEKKNEAPTVRDAVLDALRQAAYFIHQAHWLHSRFPHGVFEDVPGLCKAVTLDEIAANDYSLTPGRYVGVAAAAPKTRTTSSKSCARSTTNWPN
jgi:type I restriction enzyme M protein